MEKKLIEMKVNVNAVNGIVGDSYMNLVFDANRPTALFNAIAQATKSIENGLKRNGILTEHGVGVAEMKDYVEYMSTIVEEYEQEIYTMANAIEELDNSNMACKDMLIEMLEKKSDKLYEVVKKYYSMFDELKVVEADVEFEMNRPQVIVEDITKGENE